MVGEPFPDGTTADEVMSADEYESFLATHDIVGKTKTVLTEHYLELRPLDGEWIHRAYNAEEDTHVLFDGDEAHVTFSRLYVEVDGVGYEVDVEGTVQATLPAAMFPDRDPRDEEDRR